MATNSEPLMTVRIEWDDRRPEQVTTSYGGWQSVEEMQDDLMNRWSAFNPAKIPNGIKYRMPHYQRTHYVTLEG